MSLRHLPPHERFKRSYFRKSGRAAHMLPKPIERTQAISTEQLVGLRQNNTCQVCGRVRRMREKGWWDRLGAIERKANVVDFYHLHCVPQAIVERHVQAFPTFYQRGICCVPAHLTGLVKVP